MNDLKSNESTKESRSSVSGTRSSLPKLSMSLSLEQNNDYSVAGADITSDIYKNLRNTSVTSYKRPASIHESSVEPGRASVVSELMQPGGFRRNFLVLRNARQGKPAPVFIYENFVDYLQLYTNFAGRDELDDDNIEDENRPLLETTDDVRGGNTNGKTYFLLIKAFVGTGILFMPKAFSNGGVLFSSVALILMAFLSTVGMLLLVKAKDSMKILSFGELGRTLYGSWCYYAVEASLVLSQSGFCAAYMIFVAETLQTVILEWSGVKMSVSDLIWYQLLLYIPLSFVRKIKHFSIT
jgi:proton-coupled amino acid transporter